MHRFLLLVMMIKQFEYSSGGWMVMEFMKATVSFVSRRKQNRSWCVLFVAPVLVVYAHWTCFRMEIIIVRCVVLFLLRCKSLRACNSEADGSSRDNKSPSVVFCSRRLLWVSTYSLCVSSCTRGIFCHYPIRIQCYRMVWVGKVGSPVVPSTNWLSALIRKALIHSLRRYEW